jgi:beta-lactamase superfamily II metal-dependent hydrolase
MNLEIHVFGADQGESILVKFPNGQWGVVDCYASSTNASTNEALKYLKDLKVSYLAFVCLTHPHHDHYSGLKQVLDEIPTRQFWYPSVITRDRLSYITQLEKRNQKACTNEDRGEKLIDLWEKVGDLIDNSSLQVRRLSLGLDLGVESHLGGVQIVALGPSGNAAHSFEQKLERCFQDGKILSNKKQASINQCSIALSLTYDKHRVVLGGDVETQGWLDLLDQQSKLATSACVVKVAHHGSKTGRCDGLWEAHGRNMTNPVAVMTPFLRHRLPHRSVLDEIGRNKYLLYSTSAIARRTETVDSPDSALLKLLVGAQPPTRNTTGLVSIVLPPTGEIKTLLQGRAWQIKSSQEPIPPT